MSSKSADIVAPPDICGFRIYIIIIDMHRCVYLKGG